MSAVPTTLTAVPELVHDDLYGVDVPPSRLLSRLIGGTTLARAIYVACKLGLPDHCASAPQTPEQLAAATGADADALLRFLRVLATAGLVEADEQGRFAVTELGALLRRDVEGSMWSLAVLSNELLDPTPAGALYTARTGRASFEHVHRCGFYEYLAGHPEEERHWTDGMASRAGRLIDGVLHAVDWSGVHSVVDVGGSHGQFLAAALQRHPHLRGVVFDQPHVVAGAEAVLTDAGVHGRAEAVGGDFFISVPAGHDLYLLANVLWNWRNADALTILERCRDAMAPGGRIVIAEPVVPEGNEPHPAKHLDLANLFLFGGRARSTNEWDVLLQRAGLRRTRSTDAGLDWSVLEAAVGP